MTVTKRVNSILIDATGQAHTGPGKLQRVILYSSTTGAVTAVIYDDTAAGTDDKLTTTLVVDPHELGGEATGTREFEIGAEFENGLSVVISGTGEVMLVLER